PGPGVRPRGEPSAHRDLGQSRDRRDRDGGGMMRGIWLRTGSVLAVVSQLAGCTLMSTASVEHGIAAKADAFKDVRPAADNRDQVASVATPFFGSRVVRGTHGEALPARL